MSKNDVMSFDVTLAMDRSAVRIAMKQGDKQLGWADVAAPELDGFIALLGAMRARLADQVPMQLDPNPQLAAVDQPNWWVFDPKEDGLVPLALRHPSFGWTVYTIAPERAKEMAGWLVKYATAS